jgi:molybdopterin-containing oxidoreductase family iron-sulfur binding subunit
MPETLVPGVPMQFATSLTLNGYARGAVVESDMGRPTKVEGHPEHPSSLVATDIFGQAGVLGLYDPDRSQAVTYRNVPSSFDTLAIEFVPRLARFEQVQGRGLALLIESTTSPSLIAQLDIALRGRFPKMRLYRHDAIPRDSVYDGAKLAFGQVVETRYRLDRARVILALDAHFMGEMPGHLRYAHEFAEGRRLRDGAKRMNRLYVIESTPTFTGGSADSRLAVKAADIEGVARRLAAKLGVPGIEGGPSGGVPERWLDTLVADLKKHRGTAPIIVGDNQPAAVHALAQVMNEKLGNFGRSVIHIDPVAFRPSHTLADLTNDISAGHVDTLIIMDGNPVYNAPVDIDFRKQLAKVPFSVHWGLYHDETAEACVWHAPAAHELESWSDARAFDGTASIIQPLIAPFNIGRTAKEFLARLFGDTSAQAHDLVKGYWSEQHQQGDFETFWKKSLQSGVVAGSTFPHKTMHLRKNFAKALPQPPRFEGGGLELVFHPDWALWDGRFANNSWLEELPRPITKLTWDNAAIVSPALAERLHLEKNDVVELEIDGRKLAAPVFVLPGQPRDTVTLNLGYGRRRAGRVGTGIGVDAYALRSAKAPWFAEDLKLSKLGKSYPLYTTQHHHSTRGRGIVRTATLEQYLDEPEFVKRPEDNPTESIYPPLYDYTKGYQWGMSIDMTACIGCQACVIACQAENNIPVVGKPEVGRGHAMHWLRVDRYFAGDVDEPGMAFQPVPCMHCEKAPCEYVCPVEATTHGVEGLNEMIYQRCIGTRYCSQNCPWKVRRFNWFDYTHETKYVRPDAAENPDVTVRSRVVMEKCTYCVQRINKVRINAENAGRRIKDGEIETACQQACPTEAIIFGNINDKTSKVHRLKQTPLNYASLGELNTRPRTTYLGGVKNPNPKLAKRNGKQEKG